MAKGIQPNIVKFNENKVSNQAVRRNLLRNFIERNYGVPLSRPQMQSFLATNGHKVTLRTLDKDLLSLSILQVEAFVAGQKIRFWAQVNYVPSDSPENLRPLLNDVTIENEAIKEILRTAVDVFTDDKRVVITTGYEQAKHLALWIKNLKWPEIWYLSKEDGSVIVIETRSSERAEILKRRFWGLRSDKEIEFNTEEINE